MSVFEKYEQQANVWVKDMMDELGTDDPRRALACLRAGLQALRDRLTVEECADLAAQLPLVIRGMYFEGWRPTGKPIKARKREEFLGMVASHYGRPDEVEPEVIARATFRVLGRHVSVGELADVVLSLPDEITSLAGPG